MGLSAGGGLLWNDENEAQEGEGLNPPRPAADCCFCLVPAWFLPEAEGETSTHRQRPPAASVSAGNPPVWALVLLTGPLTCAVSRQVSR